MTNANKSVLYIRVTSNLPERKYEHKRRIDEKSFTRKYNLNKLVYYEVFENPRQAIAREKQLKKWKRDWKEASQGMTYNEDLQKCSAFYRILRISRCRPPKQPVE